MSSRRLGQNGSPGCQSCAISLATEPNATLKCQIKWDQTSQTTWDPHSLDDTQPCVRRSKLRIYSLLRRGVTGLKRVNVHSFKVQIPWLGRRYFPFVSGLLSQGYSAFTRSLLRLVIFLFKIWNDMQQQVRTSLWPTSLINKGKKQ